MRKRSFLVTTTAALWLSQMTPVSAHAQDAKQLYEQTCAMWQGRRADESVASAQAR
jgi:hypothetical protein